MESFARSLGYRRRFSFEHSDFELYQVSEMKLDVEWGRSNLDGEVSGSQSKFRFFLEH